MKRRPRPRSAAPQAVDRAPRPAGIRLETPWVVPALLALLTLVYFFEFTTSDKVIFGSDIGRDFHRGEDSFGEKVGKFGPGIWDRQLGGFPSSEEIRKDYFPTAPLSLLTTYQRHIGWRYLLTVFLAGWGMYLYMRALGIGSWPALWAAAAFMSAPTFLSFTFAGHYAKMTVIALLPWMYLCLERGMKQGKTGYFLGLAVLIALGVYSPHLQMLQYALLVVGLYFLFHLFQLYRAGCGRQLLLARTGLFALGVALGLGVGSEGLFPPYLHAKNESKRGVSEAESEQSSQDQLARARSWSLHPEEMGSLVVPEFGGFYNLKQRRDYYWGRNPGKYNSEYFGVIVTLLAIAAAFQFRRDPRVAFMSLLFAVAAAFTLGQHTPVHWLAFHLLPGGKVLRTVGMAAFLFAFPACVLAGFGLQRFLSADPANAALLRKRLLIIGGTLTATAALITMAPHAVLEIWVSLVYPDITQAKRQIMQASVPQLVGGGLIATFLCTAATATLWAAMRGKVSAAIACCALIALTLFDAWRIDKLFLVYEDPARYPDKRLENRATVSYLGSSGELFRVFPIPSFQLLRSPGYHLDGVDVVTGFNNYTIRRYDRLLREFDSVLYYLSARHAEGKEVPYSDAQLLQSVQPLLNLLNARYLVTPKQLVLDVPEFPEVFARENLRLYENPQSLPWVYLASSYLVEPDEEKVIATLREGRVNPQDTPVLESAPALPLPRSALSAGDRVVTETNDPKTGLIRMSVWCEQPRLLVVSENYYPNWRAYIDGVETPIQRANYIWKAVAVPAGEHAVELRYHSRPVAYSRAVTLLSMAAIAVLLLPVFLRLPRRWRGESPNPQPAAAPTNEEQ